MKNFIYTFLILISVNVAFAQTKKPAAKPSPKAKPATSKAPTANASNCILTSYSAGSDAYKITYQLENNEKNITRVVSTFGKKITVFEYAYDSLSRLISITDTSTKKALEYVYNDKNQLIEIKGSGSFLPRKFEYDETGKIVRQVTTYKNGEPQTTHEYSYDPKGLLTKITVYDSQKEKSMTFLPVFDGKKNPLKDLGLNINSGESLLGYPANLYNGNVVKLTTIYDKSPSYQVNGKKLNPGDKEVKSYTYKYNTSGYPTETSTKQANGVISKQLLGYDCKPKK